MSVRQATNEDLPTLKQLIEEFRTDHKAGFRMPYDAPLFMQTLSLAMDNDDALILLLDDNQGFFLGAIGQTPYSPAKVANELLWYTRPTSRGKGMHMFRTFMRWAKEKQVEYVLMTMPEPSEALVRLGFFQADVWYVKRIGEPPTNLGPPSQPILVATAPVDQSYLVNPAQ